MHLPARSEYLALAAISVYGCIQLNINDAESSVGVVQTRDVWLYHYLFSAEGCPFQLVLSEQITSNRIDAAYISFDNSHGQQRASGESEDIERCKRVSRTFYGVGI